MSSNLLSFAFGQNCDRSMADKNIILGEIYRPYVLWCVAFMQLVCICILRVCDCCIPKISIISFSFTRTRYETYHFCLSLSLSLFFWYSYINKEKGQSGVVDLVTRHRMDGLEFDSPCGEIFRTCPDRSWSSPSLP
jgi:hypothetical protein